MNKQDKLLKGIVKSLSKDWKPEERETSILYEHNAGVVHLETSHTFTARRWYELFKDDEEVRFDLKAETFKMTVPAEYCRKPELVIKPKHR